MFTFVASHILSAGRGHPSAFAELLCLIERLDDLHAEVQGMISSPHLATTIIYNMSGWWSLYINRCVAALASEDLEALGANTPFSL